LFVHLLIQSLIDLFHQSFISLINRLLAHSFNHLFNHLTAHLTACSFNNSILYSYLLHYLHIQSLNLFLFTLLLIYLITLNPDPIHSITYILNPFITLLSFFSLFHPFISITITLNFPLFSFFLSFFLLLISLLPFYPFSNQFNPFFYHPFMIPPSTILTLFSLHFTYLILSPHSLPLNPFYSLPST
jgi:hypothetical protein